MRTIKFRGYNRKNEKWLYGFYLQNRGLHFVCPDEFATGKTLDDYEIDPETLGQFTGECDKNDTEIYEGDIMRSDDYPFSDGREKDSYLGVVFYTEDDSFEVMQFVTKQSKVRGISNFINRPFYDINMQQVEVIGNIYDNQGLFRDSDEKIMEWYNS